MCLRGDYAHPVCLCHASFSAAKALGVPNAQVLLGPLLQPVLKRRLLLLETGLSTKDVTGSTSNGTLRASGGVDG